MLSDFIKPAEITSISERVQVSDGSPKYLAGWTLGEIMGEENYSSPQIKFYQRKGVILLLRA